MPMCVSDASVVAMVPAFSELSDRDRNDVGTRLDVWEWIFLVDLARNEVCGGEGVRAQGEGRGEVSVCPKRACPKRGITW